MFWKMLFSMKALVGIVVLFFASKFFFRKKIKQSSNTPPKNFEERIYQNVRRAVVEGYNSARHSERNHKGIEDDSYL